MVPPSRTVEAAVELPFRFQRLLVSVSVPSREVAAPVQTELPARLRLSVPAEFQVLPVSTTLPVATTLAVPPDTSNRLVAADTWVPPANARLTFPFVLMAVPNALASEPPVMLNVFSAVPVTARP